MQSILKPLPNFRSQHFLEQHIQNTLRFYQKHAKDPAGGFYHCFRNDGSVYDARTRHLVSSTRFVFNYAMAARYFNDATYKNWARHALAYLQQHQSSQKGYTWLLEDGQIKDATNHAYGLAFVMVAGATALLAGIQEGRKFIDHAWILMQQHFWDSEKGLLADEASADFSSISSYRGQNSNMHACEALIWAFEATREPHFLNTAERIADGITRQQAAFSHGLIWEHYTADWKPDWQYNLDNPKHLFRPWGFQPGHHTEWAKLLLILNRHRPNPAYVQRARFLFDQAVTMAWDSQQGGLFYGFAPDGSICDSDKYFWVQAESLAAAALLAEFTQETHYIQWYERIWTYSWHHMIDHRHGAWFRILNRQNQTYDQLKSPPGKTDYHTMGACYEVLRSGFALPYE